MASCLISITGSGTIKITYSLLGITNTIVSGIGSFSIDDTATSVSYIKLSGTPIVTCSCLTLIELLPKSYDFSWNISLANSYKLVQFISDSVVLKNSTLGIHLDDILSVKNFLDIPESSSATYSDLVYSGTVLPENVDRTLSLLTYDILTPELVFKNNITNSLIYIKPIIAV